MNYIEIYKENVYDLLDDRKKVVVDPNGNFDAKDVEVNDVDETTKILDCGSKQRKSSTNDNKRLSSRSHAIFRIVSLKVFLSFAFKFESILVR